MPTYEIKALADDVDVLALVWESVSRTLIHQGTVHVGSSITHKEREFTLHKDQTIKHIAGVGRVNGEARAAMPQNVNDTTVIGEVLLVTKIGDDQPTELT